MRVIIKNTAEEASLWTANHIIDSINGKPDHFVIGLCTGSTPIETYAEIIRQVKAGKVSFRNVVSFNMDEYVGLPLEHPESYHSFMAKYLFDHIDEPAGNIHIPDGLAPDLAAGCAAYEAEIVKAGGIDLFFGGIGEDGHIAFNEPFSSFASRTRAITLTEDTLRVNSRFFGYDMNKVPKQAISVGVGTINDAREVVILATGPRKARAVRDAIEGACSHCCTVSSLQMHPNAVIVLDEEAAGELKVNTYRYFKSI